MLHSRLKTFRYREHYVPKDFSKLSRFNYLFIIPAIFSTYTEGPKGIWEAHFFINFCFYAEIMDKISTLCSGVFRFK